MGNFISRIFSGHKTRLHEIKSQEEQDYVKNLKGRADKGTLDLDYLNQVAGRRASEQGELMKTKQQGRMIQSGMQNSIIAQELARKTDQSTLSDLAEESRRLAMANEQTKISAQDAMGEYGLMRSNRLMNIAKANAEYRRQESAERRKRYGKLLGGVSKMFMPG